MPLLDLNSATASLTGTTTFGALAAVSGDTLTVRALAAQDGAKLLAFGRKGATAGMCRIRSPFLHDDVNGIRGRVLAADSTSLVEETVDQPLRPQDPLIFESTGGAAAEQESGWILAYYESLTLGQGTYINAAELNARTIEYVTLETPTTGGAAATWGTSAFSAGTGILKANQWYAIVGYVLDVACTAVAALGPDFGNLKAGGPGLTIRNFTRDWFERLSRLSGLRTIPCFNAQNASGTLSYVVDSAGATAVNVDWILARLK